MEAPGSGKPRKKKRVEKEPSAAGPDGGPATAKAGAAKKLKTKAKKAPAPDDVAALEAQAAAVVATSPKKRPKEEVASPNWQSLAKFRKPAQSVLGNV